MELIKKTINFTSYLNLRIQKRYPQGIFDGTILGYDGTYYTVLFDQVKMIERLTEDEISLNLIFY